MRQRTLNFITQIFQTQRRFLTAKAETAARIQNTVIVAREKSLILENEEQKLQYPLVWLRDNCQCTACFHGSSQSRIIDWSKFNVDPKLRSIDTYGDEIILRWDDDHVSKFEKDWLVERNFTHVNRANYLDEMYRPNKVYWSKDEFRSMMQTFEFKDVIGTDQALHDWLKALAQYGVSIVKNTPLDKEQIRILADRVAYIKKSHYGETFEVKAKPEVNNIAYDNGYLQLHTDLPYYEYKPGVNMLHCLIQSKAQGGDNLLADGFHVARIMKAQYPEYYRVLSQTMVNWNDIGKDDKRVYHSIYRAPVICEDREGTLVRVNYSIPQRDSFFSVPFELVQHWYEAMIKFTEIMDQETVSFKTTEGDILTFDNIRLVHGRTAYMENQGNTRHLIGAYLDWDEIYSRLRVLKGELAKK